MKNQTEAVQKAVEVTLGRMDDIASNPEGERINKHFDRYEVTSFGTTLELTHSFKRAIKVYKDSRSAGKKLWLITSGGDKRAMKVG